MMIYSFESYCRKVKKEGTESIKAVVYAKKYGNNIILIMLYLVINYYLMYVPVRHIYTYVIYVLIVMIIFIIIFKNQKVGIGLSKNNLVYVKFNLFYKVNIVHEIPLDKIKYLNIKKILGRTYVDLSFIASNGKFTKLKFYYNTIIIGLSLNEQKQNGIIITKRLKEIEKVLDKGDF